MVFSPKSLNPNALCCAFGCTHRFPGKSKDDGMEVPIVELLETPFQVDRADDEGGLHQRHRQLAMPHLHLRLPPCMRSTWHVQP